MIASVVYVFHIFIFAYEGSFQEYLLIRRRRLRSIVIVCHYNGFERGANRMAEIFDALSNRSVLIQF